MDAKEARRRASFYKEFENLEKLERINRSIRDAVKRGEFKTVVFTSEPCPVKLINKIEEGGYKTTFRAGSFTNVLTISW